MVEVLSGICQITYGLSRDLADLGVRSDVTVVLDVPRGWAASIFPFLSRRAPLMMVTWNSCPEYLRELMDHQPDALLQGERLGDDLAVEFAVLIPRVVQGMGMRPSPVTRLTHTQELALRYLAQGWNGLRIADKLHVRDHTVDNMLTEVYSKLGVDDDRDAVLYYWGIRELFQKER